MTGRTLVAAMASVLALALVDSAGAQTRRQGEGSVRIEYQYIRTGDFASSIGDLDIGNTDTHLLMLAGDYALTDRWTLFASVPYIRKRHQGAFAHNPVVDFQAFTPPDLRIVDDGEFHGGLQDLYVGAAYQSQARQCH